MARKPDEAEAGFAIGTYDQRSVEDNALEKYGPKWGEKEDRDEAMRDGLVDAEGQITQKGWDVLSDDLDLLEVNSMAWMRKTFVNAREEGHDKHDDLVGTFWFDPRNTDQAWLIQLATNNERVDMVDTSYGDLGDTAFNGVSRFGGLILGGGITFFDVKPEDMEVVEQTLEHERRRSKQSQRAREGRRPPPRRTREAPRSPAPTPVKETLMPRRRPIRATRHRVADFSSAPGADRSTPERSTARPTSASPGERRRSSSRRATAGTRRRAPGRDAGTGTARRPVTAPS